MTTYDRVLFFLVGWWELSDNLTLGEVTCIHSLIVGIVLAFFEPNSNRSERPRQLTGSTDILSQESDLILAIDKVELT